MNSVEQQCEPHHWKVPIESFHMSGHTFSFRWMVRSFLGLVKFTFGSEKVNSLDIKNKEPMECSTGNALP